LEPLLFKGDSADSVAMSEPTDLSELFLRDVHPPESEAEVEEWIRRLYEGSAGQRGLVNRYCWLRSLFRNAGANEADIDDMMNETVFRYLGPVKSALWAAAAGHLIRDEDTLMPAVREIAKQLGRPVREVLRECLFEDQHDELIDRFYGIDKLTQEDLEEDWRREQILIELDHPLVPTSRPLPGAPIDPEKLAYESPKAMIKLIAKNVLIDHLRKLKSRGDGLDDGSLEVAEDQSYDANPEAQVFAREMHSRYLAGLREVPPLQRAAWIVCRDPLLLSDEEAESLLESVLTGPQAKQAAKQRPLSVEDAARLFGRDVSPDAAKAARKLGRLLYPSALPSRSR
jgi:hypothetical protein